ncbi:hypothetical protein [Streptomyces sp. NPDC002082]|uniref:hypothetical protein n=1 Tax=Streptomyces sp. NPDC002082 TaxID=3154772 RepID=UPI00332FE173
MTPRTAGALLLAAGAIVLTGCGTRTAGAGDAAEPPAPSVTPSVTPSVDYAAQAAAAVARHDALFPAIAARCADVATGGASPGATAGELPADPEARKYAENHAFKQQAQLTPGARCRGDAHAARIKAAVAGGSGGKGAPHTVEEVRALLTGLGYGFDSGGVYGSGAVNVSFVLSVPESGPCVTGRLGPPLTVEAHGVYVEGGCLEPRGGH